MEGGGQRRGGFGGGGRWSKRGRYLGEEVAGQRRGGIGVEAVNEGAVFGGGGGSGRSAKGRYWGEVVNEGAVLGEVVNEGAVWGGDDCPAKTQHIQLILCQQDTIVLIPLPQLECSTL